MKKRTSALRNQKGQSLVEYLIIVALVAVGTLSVMRVVGQSVQVKFANIAKALGADVEGKINNAKVVDSNWQKKDLRSFMEGATDGGNSKKSDGNESSHRSNNDDASN